MALWEGHPCPDFVPEPLRRGRGKDYPEGTMAVPTGMKKRTSPAGN